MVGCSDGGTLGASSIGRPYELFVVATKTVWDGPAGDTTRAIFGEDVEMINQAEPIYDLFNVPPENYKTTVARHRNILVLTTGTQYAKSDMKAEYDVEAQPQLRVTVTAPSADSMAAFLGKYRSELVKLYDMAERDRFINRANSFRDETIRDSIRSQFGFTMNIPKGYTIRNAKKDFMWISFELPLASIGFVIYTYPADSIFARNFRPQEIILNRNAAVMQVPGPSDGSYMKTSLVFPPQQNLLVAHGREWSQMRGFWDVQGDFMGGPFINYTTYDPVHNRMISIDGYVYNPSPNNPIGKRNYIRQIEAIFLTARVPNQ